MKRLSAMVLLIALILGFAGCMAPDPDIRPVTSGETDYIDVGELPAWTEETPHAEGSTNSTASGEAESSAASQTNAPATGQFVSHPSMETSAGSKTATTSSRTQSTGSAPTVGTTAGTTNSVTPPAVSSEFRGVWISYIELSRMLNGKTVAQVKAAIDTVMDNSRSYGLNAVILHVRANSDAYYQSSLFPAADAAKNLLGVGFDPLAYAAEAAHKRGLELHAWVNPYRIGDKIANKRCEDYFQSGGRYYYVPTSDKAKKLILDGVRELLQYDIDGIHFDDYFYPSVNAIAPESFEKEDYENYKKSAGAGAMSPGDWRRSHVDALIAGAYSAVHQKKGCVFGVSPRHSYQENYASLYADTKKWLAQSGYVDYLCPQIYFGFEHPTAAFTKMVDEWLGFPRASTVQLYVGLGLYKTGIDSDTYAGDAKNEWKNNTDIMKRSVQYLQGKQNCGGFAFYSYTFFDPTTKRDSSYNVQTASKEIENLLSVLKNRTMTE